RAPLPPETGTSACETGQGSMRLRKTPQPTGPLSDGGSKRPSCLTKSARPHLDPLQERDEIVRHVIHVRLAATGELPVLAEHLTAPLRHHQHGGHAERVWHCEVAREILEHRALGGIDAVTLQESMINLRQRLWLEVGGGDVENVLEVPVDL